MSGPATVLAALTFLAPAIAQERTPPGLHGRVLGIDAKPVAGEQLPAVILCGIEKTETVVRTAADGALDFSLPTGLHFDHEVRVVLMRRNLAGVTVYHGAALIRLPGGATGITDCGDVRLVEEPVLLRGTVLDPEGKPLAGVELETPLSHFADAGGKHRRTLIVHRVRTDAAGQFTVRELEPAAVVPKLEMSDHGKRHLMEQAPVGGDVHELRIVVGEAGSLLLRMDGKPHLDLQASLRSRSGNLQAGFTILPNGDRLLSDLPPGSYDLEVRHEGRAKVWVIDGLVIRPGEQCRDPRLANWITNLRFLTVRLPAPWTEPEPVKLVLVRNADGKDVLDFGDLGRHARQPGSATETEQKVATFVLRNCDRNRLEVSHPEYVTQRLDEPKGEVIVTLCARPKVRLVAPEPLQLPNGTLVRLFDRPPDGDPATTRGLDAAIGTLMRPDGPGKKLVVLFADKPGPATEAWRGEIEVPAAEGVQELTLPVDRAVVAKLAALLARDR